MSFCACNTFLCDKYNKAPFIFNSSIHRLKSIEEGNSHNYKFYKTKKTDRNFLIVHTNVCNIVLFYLYK